MWERARKTYGAQVFAGLMLILMYLLAVFHS